MRRVVLDRHCKQLFMKQVLPKLESPTRPKELLGVITI